MSEGVRLLGSGNRARFVKLLEDGDMEINYEVYGGVSGPDQETILVVSQDEFAAIKNRYGFDESISVLEALFALSASGRGDEFINDLSDGTIPLKSKFVF
jgi:hypothetical protein